MFALTPHGALTFPQKQHNMDWQSVDLVITQDDLTSLHEEVESLRRHVDTTFATNKKVNEVTKTLSKLSATVLQMQKRQDSIDRKMASGFYSQKLRELERHVEVDIATRLSVLEQNT